MGNMGWRGVLVSGDRLSLRVEWSCGSFFSFSFVGDLGSRGLVYMWRVLVLDGTRGFQEGIYIYD